MSRNKKSQNNEVSNLEVAAIEQPVAQPATEEQAIEAPVTEEPTNAVDQAAAELEELKAKMAEAKRKLAEAKKANTKSRPVRMSTFIVQVCQTKAEAIAGVGEQMSKSDVHYCAEKAAIDVLAEDIKCGQRNEYFYAIIKRGKADTEGVNDILVETLWIDQETNQIVIE